MAIRRGMDQKEVDIEIHEAIRYTKGDCLLYSVRFERFHLVSIDAPP